MSTKPLLRWAGSKQPLLPHLLLPHLLPRIAATPHSVFAEVFAGGLSVTLAKPRSPVEVINDFHGELVNFYRCAQRHAPELRRVIRFQINSRELFDEAKRATHGTEIERAERFWFLNAVSFGGDNNSFGAGCKKKRGVGGQTSWPFRLRGLKNASRRLERVCIEQVSWERCLALYDSPETLFFLDPPYVGGKQKAYASWSLDTMRGFAETVRAVKGLFIVTVGDTPEMRALWRGCKLSSISRNRGINNAAKAQYKELIITP